MCIRDSAGGRPDFDTVYHLLCRVVVAAGQQQDRAVDRSVICRSAVVVVTAGEQQVDAGG